MIQATYRCKGAFHPTAVGDGFVVPLFRREENDPSHTFLQRIEFDVVAGFDRVDLDEDDVVIKTNEQRQLFVGDRPIRGFLSRNHGLLIGNVFYLREALNAIVPDYPEGSFVAKRIRDFLAETRPQHILEQAQLRVPQLDLAPLPELSQPSPPSFTSGGMETRVQRAILLKAIMEAMGKSRGFRQADFYEGKSERLRGPFNRFNASPETLVHGLETYADTVRQMLDNDPSAVPASPLWKQILAFALDEEDGIADPHNLPRALAGLERWRASNDRRELLADMGGSWFLFRPSSTGGTKEREVVVSLLNIRPESYYSENPSSYTEFAMTSPAGRGAPLVRVHGICRYQPPHLHLLGILDKASTPLTTAMVLRYEDGPRARHRMECEGILLTTNSQRQQFASPVIAVYISESNSWTGQQYDENTKILGQRLGSFQPSDIEDILPISVNERLISRAQGEFVYQAP